MLAMYSEGCVTNSWYVTTSDENMRQGQSMISTAVKANWQLIQLWSAAATLTNEWHFAWCFRAKDFSFVFLVSSLLFCFFAVFHVFLVAETKTRRKVTYMGVRPKVIVCQLKGAPLALQLPKERRDLPVVWEWCLGELEKQRCSPFKAWQRHWQQAWI